MGSYVVSSYDQIKRSCLEPGGGGGGGYSLVFLVGGEGGGSVLQILTLFQTKNNNFLVPCFRPGAKFMNPCLVKIYPKYFFLTKVYCCTTQ